MKGDDEMNQGLQAISTLTGIIFYFVFLILEIYFVYWTIKNIKDRKKEIDEIKNRLDMINFEKEQYKKDIARLEDKVKYLEWKNGKTPE